MLTMSEIVMKSRSYDFSTNLVNSNDSRGPYFLRSYYGFKWLLRQVWDKKLWKITIKISIRLVILKKGCETFPKKALAEK